MKQALNKMHKKNVYKNKHGNLINRCYKGRTAYKLEDYRNRINKKVDELEIEIQRCRENGEKDERKRVLKQILALKNRLHHREHSKSKNDLIHEKERQIKGTLEIVKSSVPPEVYQKILGKY